MNFKKFSICCILSVSVILISNYSYASSFMAGGLRLNKKVKTLREIKRTNVVQQSLDFSCGAAGLSTLFNYYLNDPTHEEEIIATLLNLVPLEKVRARRGFSLFDLKTFAQEKGYKVTGYKMNSDFIKELDVPILVPIKFRNYRHFVVVKGIVKDRVFIADPAAGNVSMKIDQFERMWLGGIGLVIEYDNVNDETRDYALKVSKEDLVFSDYRNIKRIMSQNAMRTALQVNEWPN